VKILIFGRKVYLKEEGKTLLGNVNKLFVLKKLLTTPNNALPLHLKQTFPPIILIFIDSEGDEMKSRLPLKKKFYFIKQIATIFAWHLKKTLYVMLSKRCAK
jgi:hypothetical protein